MHPHTAASFALLRVLGSVSLALGLVPGLARAQFAEVEPNDDKASATYVVGFGPGDTIVGTSTGALTDGSVGSADFYRILLDAPPTPGIYRHNLILRAPVGVGSMTFALIGRGQTGSFGAGGTLDSSAAVVQSGNLHIENFCFTTGSCPRSVLVYTVADSAELYVRVVGSASSTLPYTISVVRDPVPVTDLGAFAAGSITVETTQYSPRSIPVNPGEGSDLWVYDANCVAIPGYGNDNQASDLNARLVRAYTPGTYTIALTNRNLANDQASPSDEHVYRPVLDFPGVVATSFNGTLQLARLRISDGVRNVESTQSSLSLNAEVLWVTFVVTAPPDTDQDGLTDADETGVYGTDPFDADTDDDGLDDGEEVALAAFGGCPSPLVADSDMDGLGDGAEVSALLDPCDSDFDDDGLADGLEAGFGAHPAIADTDADGLLDGTEVDMAAGSGCPSPVLADSDFDALSDAFEVALGTSPCNSDSDGDGVPDNVDPLPTEPGVTSGFLEDATRDLATDIALTSLGAFNGPNANANNGRRNALANRATAAANAIAAGDYATAIAELTSLLEKIDGLTPPPDWMDPSPEKTALASEVELLIALLSY